MSDKFKKINKQLQLTDSTVNSYGFRLLTAGYLMDEYKRNPIGFYMHDRENGVLVKWDDLKCEGDKVFGTPCINMSHPRGQRTVDEIESGFLNAASFGHFVVLEMSTEPTDMLPGQKGPTVTKWFNRECSLVDIPGNFNSLKLYDEDDNEINLADFKNQILNMKQITFSLEQLKAMGLSAEAEQTAVHQAFQDLVAKAAKADGLEQKLATEATEKQTAIDALAALKGTTAAKEVDAILDTALAAGKVTVLASTQLKTAYAEKPNALKALVDALPVYKSIAGQLGANGESDDLSKKSWNELDESGELENLKATDLNLFKSKFKARFGTDYTGS